MHHFQNGVKVIQRFLFYFGLRWKVRERVYPVTEQTEPNTWEENSMKILKPPWINHDGMFWCADHDMLICYKLNEWFDQSFNDLKFNVCMNYEYDYES